MQKGKKKLTDAKRAKMLTELQRKCACCGQYLERPPKIAKRYGVTPQYVSMLRKGRRK